MSRALSVEKEKRYLTPNEVAELLMVAPVTVRSWAQKGLLRAHTTPGGHRRFLKTEVERFALETGASDTNQRLAARRLLIVEDDVQLATMLTELLSGTNPSPTVEVANNGFDAGRKMLTFNPEIVLLDLMMPGLNGFEVCRQIKSDAAFRHVRVVAMTGYPSPENINAIMQAGAERCLTKPLDMSALLEALALQSQQPPQTSLSSPPN